MAAISPWLSLPSITTTTAQLTQALEVTKLGDSHLGVSVRLAVRWLSTPAWHLVIVSIT